MFTLASSLGVLTIGFILHLTVRGFWIMKIGLATFSDKPLRVEEMGYKKVFERRISERNLTRSAVQLGKLSSFIFSITFFFLLVSLGISTVTVILLGASFYFGVPEYFAFGLLFLLLLDFISFGYLKRKKLGVILYPILFVLYFLSLSFLYKDIYYYLINNIQRKYLLLSMILFMLSWVGVGYIDTTEILLRPINSQENKFENYNLSFYDDERKPNSIYLASIDSYYQDKGMLKLYINKRTIVEEALRAENLKIHISNQEVVPFAIRNYQGPEKQAGYLFFLNISDLKQSAEYQIKITLDDKAYLSIPFYKE